jgi:CubicO group peptidase (beta-lactamase class C family)
MRTFGWIVGELVRRVTGSSVGTFLRTEIADPLDIDFWIGLPADLESCVARLVPPADDMRAALAPLADSLLLARVFDNPSGLFNYDEMWNTRALHAAELPSSNGIGDARALARLTHRASTRVSTGCARCRPRPFAVPPRNTCAVPTQ